MNRRQCIQSTLGVIAGAGSAREVGAGRTGARTGPTIKLCEIFSPGREGRLRLARQIGVTHVIAGVTGALSKARREEYVDVLTKIRNDFGAAGMKIAGVESHPVPAEKIKLGLAGRDEEIENYRAAIDALARTGVPMICHNFMAGLGWYRTRVDLPERGGALTSEFDNEVALKQGLTEWGTVSEEKLWSSIEYFLKAVMPVAEKVGVKMARRRRLVRRPLC